MLKSKNSPVQLLRQLVAGAVLAMISTATLPAAPPDATLNLKLAVPINSWDEAVPLGNGLMGGLLWGGKNLVRLSLDRGDLWDERPAVEKDWWKKETWAKGGDWDAPYNGVTPTKLPAGRLEITLDPAQEIKSFELNLATAEGFAHFTDGTKLDAFFSAASPVALIRIPGPEPKSLVLIPSGAKNENGNAGPSSGGTVSRLGYPPAKYGSEGRAQWYVQDAAGGLKYCAFVETKRVGTETLVAVAVTSTRDGADLLSLARQRCSAALVQGYAALLKPHADWWNNFWSQSSLHVPEPDIERQYYLVRYFYGAASRRGAPPMPLQGVWTADNGGLPPWKGDYHNDLNTQMTYIGYHGAGNFDEGACFLDYLFNLLPVFRNFARDFYEAPGAAVPGVMSLAGQPLGGWGQYSLSPTMGAWNAHLFYLHWRYTADDEFLRTRAYPFCREIGECERALLQPGTNGVLKLLRSSSPEIFDNSDRAWLEPNSNYDLACLKMLFLSLSEMADALGKAEEAKSWAATAAALGDFHAAEDGALLLDAKTPLPGSHRHFSNIMEFFPFNLITCEGSERDQQRIKASLAQWDKFGTGAWCGYSFSWMSCLRARVGDAETALRDLDIFVHAFILRNGFHANGDQTKSGFSGFTYRPFTLEGNFLAMEAVHEMLLQSWSPTPGKRDTEVIRIFPATPWRWHEASFTDLRAEGGHRVSAKRENNATTWFRIVAGSTGTVRIRDNFGGREPEWNIRGVQKIGDNFEVVVKKGAVVEAALAKPAVIPPAPANLAEPAVIPAHSAIQPNTLPLRIGADSDGNNRFIGDLARVAVFNRVLAVDEIEILADKHNADWDKATSAVLTLNGEPAAHERAGFNLKFVQQVEVVPADGGLDGKMFHLTGAGYLEIPHRTALNCPDGVTLAAWIRPAASPAGGMRIIDKSPVGAASAYLLDTYPNNSLRLITRDPHLIFDAKLPLNEWTHVAATVNGKNGKQVLFVNGKVVAESP
jgi:alpha-L-fucosidase 2